MTIIERIRQSLVEHGHLAVDASQLDEQSDLYQAGLSSHASVALMLALEDAFEIEFPERLLRRRTFESIAAIHEAVEEVTRSPVGAE